MKTKLITTLNSRVLLVEIPKESEAVAVMEDVIYYKDSGMNNEDYPRSLNIPKGKWQLLSTLKDLTDSDCVGLVETDEISDVEDSRYEVIYIDYQDEERAFGTPKESFLSALRASGIMFKNPFGDKPNFYVDSYTDMFTIAKYSRKEQEWQEAEQNVFTPETLVFVEQ